MPCVISSPSTDSGKTTLSLLISCWAFSKGIKIQTFKVGPDYLDQQQLSSIGQPICRNLDIFLSGEEWVKESFFKHSLKYEFSLIEGAMGLFDGLGSTTYSSTANVAKLLNAPIIFIVNASGQVASLLATVRGFRDFDSKLLIKGIIFNNVNSDRHKKLIKEVFKNEEIEILGFLPSDSKITLNKANLGLISPMENEKEIDVEYFANFAERNLDVFSLIKFLKSPQKKIFNSDNFKDFKINKIKVDNQTALEDWICLMLSRNIIQSNSSFCWTASLFNKKISIQPKNGYGYNDNFGPIPHGFYIKNSIIV